MDIDEQYKYFGFEISISPNSEIFKKACLRAPDLIFKISLPSQTSERWLILWRSYENSYSERGMILRDGKEIEQKNCLSFLPLSVVLFSLAEADDIGRVCTRFFSIIPRSTGNKSNCDIPPINLRLLRDRLSSSGNNIDIKICTPRQFKALYRLKLLTPVPTWKVQPKIIERFALELFTRASYIASLINDERAFECLLPVYRELSHYGGLLLGFFEDKKSLVATEAENGRKLFRSLMHKTWYSGSQHQQKVYPSGLMKDWAEDIGRYVLYDFQPGRRLKYTESEGKGYVMECDNKNEALFFDESRNLHILPENISPLLIHSSTTDWIRMAP